MLPAKFWIFGMAKYLIKQWVVQSKYATDCPELILIRRVLSKFKIFTPISTSDGTLYFELPGLNAFY